MVMPSPECHGRSAMATATGPRLTRAEFARSRPVRGLEGGRSRLQQSSYLRAAGLTSAPRVTRPLNQYPRFLCTEFHQQFPEDCVNPPA